MKKIPIIRVRDYSLVKSRNQKKVKGIKIYEIESKWTSTRTVLIRAENVDEAEEKWDRYKWDNEDLHETSEIITNVRKVRR